MKLYIILITMLHTSSMCLGQFNYKYSVNHEPWQPLVNPVSINNGFIWDEESFKIPLGFTFILDGVAIDTLGLAGPTFIATDTTNNLRGFFTFDADFCDRGYHTGGPSVSPIQYEVSGLSGSRICKIEYLNMGFWIENDLFQTNEDFVNLQVWLYEADNSIEFHYGPSRITHPSDYFVFNGNPAVGLFRLNYDNNSIDTAYYLHGDIQNPLLDSIFNQTATPVGLDTVPPSGFVCRFQPATTGIKDIGVIRGKIKIFPTIVSTTLTIENNSTEALSFSIHTINEKQLNISGSIKTGINQVDVGKLPVGTYLLNVRAKRDSYSYRFIKE